MAGDLSQSVKPKKAKRKLESISDDETLRLIEWVKLKSMLWNKSDPRYQKKQDKMVLWDEACRYLNSAKLKSGEDVATEWKAIRDLFVKMDKESSKSGSGVYYPTGHRHQLIWLNANFFSRNIHHTTARTNIQNFPWDNRDNRETLTSSQKEKEKDNSQRENINIDNVSNVSSCPPSPTPQPHPS